MKERDSDVRRVPTDVSTAMVPTDGLAAEELPEEVLTPGVQLGGRYRIVTRLGRGGMGVVYHADDLKLGEPVALKFLGRASAEKSRVASLIEEVRIGRKIAHPNVCRLHDIVEIGARHFISMEFVEGEDLDLLIRRAGRLPLRRAIGIARDVCEGVKALHDAGVIHRDLKPANVLVDRRGRARVSDFGLATSVHSGPGSDSRLSGTLPYMAPEQFSGGEVGVATDIYSLGLVLWELFAGERALESSTFEEVFAFHAAGSRVRKLVSIVPDIPVVIEDIVGRCLEPDPSRRPSSADEVLRAIPGGDPLDAAIEEGETPTPEMVAASSMKGEMTWLALAAAVVVIGVGTVTSGWVFNEGVRAPIIREMRSPDEMNQRAGHLLTKLTGRFDRNGMGAWVSNDTMITHLERSER